MDFRQSPLIGLQELFAEIAAVGVLPGEPEGAAYVLTEVLFESVKDLF